jgi:hypothetical protein
MLPRPGFEFDYGQKPPVGARPAGDGSGFFACVEWVCGCGFVGHMPQPHKFSRRCPVHRSSIRYVTVAMAEEPECKWGEGEYPFEWYAARCWPRGTFARPKAREAGP